jgi:hypothetical protein
VGRVTALALLLVAPGCGGGSEAPDPCATLPACPTPATAAEAYGQPCAVALGDGWRGKPVCCTGKTVAAACVTRGLGGEPCDPAQALSCAFPLVCGEDPSCSGPCCVPPTEGSP